MNDAYEKIRSYRTLYGMDAADLYDLERVEQGVCYKHKGLPHIFEILTYRKRENRLRALKVFGIQIAKWVIKKKKND